MTRDTIDKAQPYTHAQDHLRDYLALLTARLHQQVQLARALRGPGTDEAFLGMFLSDHDLDTILAQLHESAPVQLDSSDDPRPMAIDLDRRIQTLAQRIETRLAVTQAPLRITHLAEAFELSANAVEVVLMLLAPQVDNRFSRVYAYLHDDVTRRLLTPALAMRFLPNAPASPSTRAEFCADSSLFRHQLVRFADPGDRPAAAMIDRPMLLDDRIVEYLLDHDPLCASLQDLATLQQPSGSIRELAIDPGVKLQLDHLRSLWQTGTDVAAFFIGQSGAGKSRAAAALARELGCPLLALDAAALAQRPAEKIPDLVRLAMREIRLLGAVVHVRHVDTLQPATQGVLFSHAQKGVIFSADRDQPLTRCESVPVRITFSVSGYDLRRLVWEKVLEGQASLDRTLADALAGRFELTAGSIHRAARSASLCARLRAGPDAAPEPEDYYDGCRREANPLLARAARKHHSPHTWDDLKLPVTTLNHLRTIETQIRQGSTVLDRWGFGGKIASAHGTRAMFSGPPGTGKTMAAGILAASIGLDMYRIDLSGVVSKYIGETEKNLSQIFDEAAAANVVLFFDEADALFGKRSEVKDAHDRYANIETSYLLQKMEEHQGITVLATNFSQNVDKAFIRRLDHVIEFPFPDADQRRRIWQSLFPHDAPLDTDVDFEFLAQRFDLSGGHIRNCVLTGAFLAAERDAAIGMDHLVQAVARELAKLGRPLKRERFAQFYKTVRKATS